MRKKTVKAKPILTKSELALLERMNQERRMERSELERQKAIATWEKRRAKKPGYIPHTASGMTLNQRLALEAGIDPNVATARSIPP
jgi:epoxyqueuosine reductase QueG